MKGQGCGKWPWTWWGRRKGQGHRPRHPGHGEWQKGCINICKHILMFSNCVLVRVPINNYKQPIALFVIILARTPSQITMVQFNVIGVGANSATRINKHLCQHMWEAWKMPFVFAVASYQLHIKSEVYWSTIGGHERSNLFNLQLLGIEFGTNFVYQTNNK